jgi:hypothetical protein
MVDSDGEHDQSGMVDSRGSAVAFKLSDGSAGNAAIDDGMAANGGKRWSSLHNVVPEHKD